MEGLSLLSHYKLETKRNHLGISNHFLNKKVVSTAHGIKIMASGFATLQKAKIKPPKNGLSEGELHRKNKNPQQNAPKGKAKTPKRIVMRRLALSKGLNSANETKMPVMMAQTVTVKTNERPAW